MTNKKTSDITIKNKIGEIGTFYLVKWSKQSLEKTLEAMVNE